MTQSILLNKIINNQVKIELLVLVMLVCLFKFFKIKFFVVGFDKNKKYLNNIRKNKNIIGKLDISI